MRVSDKQTFQRVEVPVLMMARASTTHMFNCRDITSASICVLYIFIYCNYCVENSLSRHLSTVTRGLNCIDSRMTPFKVHRCKHLQHLGTITAYLGWGLSSVKGGQSILTFLGIITGCQMSTLIQSYVRVRLEPPEAITLVSYPAKTSYRLLR